MMHCLHKLAGSSPTRPKVLPPSKDATEHSDSQRRTSNFIMASIRNEDGTVNLEGVARHVDHLKG